MKRFPVSKLAAVVAVVVGIWWFGSMGLGPIRYHLSGETTVSHFFLYIGFYMFLWTPAILCLFFGIRLLFNTTKRTIRGAIGSLCVVLVVCLDVAIGTSIVSGDAKSGSPIPSLILLITTLGVIPIYAVTCKAIVKREGIPTNGYREFLSKTVVVIVALQIWSVGTSLVLTYAPPGLGNDDIIADSLQSMVLGLAPIFIAWGFYRVSVWLIERESSARPNAVAS